MPFIKNKENFICQKCKKETIGNGYTDHCPHCLWSKHVDINPGDRASDCGGLMEPIGVKVKSDEYTIYYRCQKCGYRHRVKATKYDNINEIIRLTTELLYDNKKD
ncbi:MAG: RNHCP domain-containing protein [bacterium]